MNARPRRLAAEVAASAILRRVRLHGPQTMPALARDLPWGDTTIRTATVALVEAGHVVKLPPASRPQGSRGLSACRYAAIQGAR